MAELEKVKTGLECCAIGAECDHCPYAQMNESKHDFTGCHQLHWDAIELLKEKQPLSPVWDNEPFSGRVVWFCPNCNEGIDKFAFGRNLSITHCPYCGQSITWKDGEHEDDHLYEQQSDYRDHWITFEPTYNQEDGSR